MVFWTTQLYSLLRTPLLLVVFGRSVSEATAAHPMIDGDPFVTMVDLQVYGDFLCRRIRKCRDYCRASFWPTGRVGYVFLGARCGESEYTGRINTMHDI